MPVNGFEEAYEVSNMGRVRSKDRVIKRGNTTQHRKGKLLALSACKDGYLQVRLSYNGVQRMCLVHRLVAEMFIANPDNKPEINHIDHVRTNNCVNNLEWVTRLENTRDCPHEGARNGRSVALAVTSSDGNTLFHVSIKDFASWCADQHLKGFSLGHLRRLYELYPDGFEHHGYIIRPIVNKTMPCQASNEEGVTTIPKGSTPSVQLRRGKCRTTVLRPKR